MKPPEYYIQSVEITSSPNFGDIKQYGASFNVSLDKPEYSDEHQGLLTDYDIDIKLYDMDEIEDPPDEIDDSMAEVIIEAETTIFIEGEEDEFREILQSVDEELELELEEPDFIRHLESGVISKILAPLSALVDNSARGILPEISFVSIAVEHGERDEEDEEHDSNKE